MILIIEIFIFILGAIVGSFLNVVIFRYGNMFSSKPRSACFSCNHKLSFLDLVPILSFIFLGGRCRYCKSKISLQYPLVEVSSALFFLFTYFKLGLSVEFVFFAIVWSALLAIFVYDLRHKIIPDGLAYLLILLSFGYMIVSNLPSVLLLDFLSGPIVASPFAILWFVSKGRWMGFGDVKLALAIGWFEGLFLGLSAITFAFWIGAIVGLLLVFLSKIGLSRKFKNLTIKSEIPFAPFLILGMLIVFFLELSAFSLFLLF